MLDVVVTESPEFDNVVVDFYQPDSSAGRIERFTAQEWRGLRNYFKSHDTYRHDVSYDMMSAEPVDLTPLTPPTDDQLRAIELEDHLDRERDRVDKLIGVIRSFSSAADRVGV